MKVELKPHTKALKHLFHNKALKNLYVATILSSHFSNKEILVQTRRKGYYSNAINVRISFNGYGSKIRKVSKYRPTVSNESILATK